ncbi:MFS transporter [Gottschalkiaceae bacterium SANA]|nr:MFS transporter [Gottschalkiaceae bacterium SANA]
MNNKERNVYLMYAIIFMQGFVFYGPVATIYRQARGLSMSEIFIIESMALLLILIFEVPWGWFADRFGYKRTLIIVNGLYFISKIIFYQAQGFEGFLLERVILALVIAGLSGCDAALIYASIKEDQAQTVFGRYSAMGTLGFLLACFASSWIVKISIDATAFFTIFPYGIAMIFTFFLVEVEFEKKDTKKLKENMRLAFADRSIVFLVVAMALMVEIFQAATVFLNQLQYQKAGIPVHYFGWILAGIQVVRLFSAKTKRVTDRWGNMSTLFILSTLVLVSCVGLVVTSQAVLSVLAILFISVSLAIMGPVEMDLKNKAIHTADRATILSIYSMIASLIGVGGNIIIGKAADHSVEMGFVICALMGGLALIAMFFFKRENEKIDKLLRE